MKEALKSEIKGIVAILKDFKSEALLPLFEAVVNAIQAIEERFGNNMDSGEIKVIVHRTAQPELPLEEQESRKEPEIVSFEIIDNGIGFNDKNLDSFKTVASSYKEKKGGKGIGRFTWLKAFDNVEISSVYLQDKQTYQRKISFSLQGLIVSPPILTSNELGTTIKLLGFKKKYQSAPSACRTGVKIAQRIMEHCLFYFIAAKNPKIILEDDRPDGSSPILDLQSMYDEVKECITPDTLEIAQKIFTLYHIKLYGTRASMHNLVLCANERDVQTIAMGKLLGTTAQFDDKDKKFTYAVYVAGDYLDEHVSANRTEFDLPNDSSSLDSETPIGQNDLQKAVAEKSKAFLAEYLIRIEQRRHEIAQKYVSEKNPALRAVIHYCPEAISEIEPTTQDDKIDEILYRHKGKAEYEIRKRSEKLLKTQKTSIEEIKKDFDDVSSQLDAFQKDNLANYMIFRKLVIDLLDKKIRMAENGKIPKENIIHDIFFPQKTTTNEINYEDHNLWLLDDRLTFHHFAASDLHLSQIMQSTSDDRPDVVAFSDVDSESRTVRSVSIIELKKALRKEYDESPSAQLLRMLKGIKEGHVVLQENGRPLNIVPTTRFYCYGLCDFTTKIRDYAKNEDFFELWGEFGYFKYHSQYQASIYLINFDKIVLDAQKRHHAFFEKLGIK